jgi:hypothetical protein
LFSGGFRRGEGRVFVEEVGEFEVVGEVVGEGGVGFAEAGEVGVGFDGVADVDDEEEGGIVVAGDLREGAARFGRA